MQSTENLYQQLQRVKNCNLALKRKLANERFSHFFNFIWSQAIYTIEGKFCPGEHIDRWCDELQDNPRTSKESARLHAKSEVLHAYEPWKFFQRRRSFELDYFSFKQELAAYHVKKIKESMLEIPEFNNVIWLSPAESVISCKWPNTKIRLQVVSQIAERRHNRTANSFFRELQKKHVMDEAKQRRDSRISSCMYAVIAILKGENGSAEQCLKHHFSYGTKFPDYMVTELQELYGKLPESGEGKG